MLDTMPPAQKMALLVGVPAVAAVVLVQKLRPAPEPAAAAPTPVGVMPSTDAIGSGQLSEFSNMWNENLANFLDNITQAIQHQEETTTPPPTTPPPTTPPPRGNGGTGTVPGLLNPSLDQKMQQVAAGAKNPYGWEPLRGPNTAGFGSKWTTSKGETIGALASRLLRGPVDWQALYMANAARWNALANSKGQKITSANWLVPAGTAVAY